MACVHHPEGITVAEANQTEPKKKGGKLIIILAVVAVLLAGGVGAGVWFFMKSQAPAHAEEAKPAPAKPPAYLPLETMVVNLADPGGERFAQLGITIELTEDKAAERIRAFLPSIRSAILLLVSQRTSEELLTRQGKEKLAADIAVVVGRPLGDAEDLEAYAKAMAQAASAAEPPKLAAARTGGNPVRGVLFSSFIIQ